MEVELIDLTTTQDDVEDQNVHGKGYAVLRTTLQRPNAVAAHGQGDTAHLRPTLCEQKFIAVGDDAVEAVKSEILEFSAAKDVVGEAIRSADQEFVVAGDCTEEVMLSGDQDLAAAVADTEETMQSGTQECAAAGDKTGDAMHSGNSAQATTSSSNSEQVAISSMTEQVATTSSSMTEQCSRDTAAFLCFHPMSTASAFPRQFWKAGEYSVTAQPTINSIQNHLRIHPKFLHSNATSHKWAFGAIAELLDNAVDEVNNGATFVKIDKIKSSPFGEYSLVIQDDGGGMSPESLRHCMSFGFSKKSGNSSIGQYGNGFKTSTMRLGADVIVFSCTQDNRRLTRSIGLLSYTFLTRTGCNDILVPAVDYEFDESSHTFKRINYSYGKHFSSNLSTILGWSPFTTEDDLLNQFEDMGCHGTKVIIFNLWFNDAWEMELDFASDEELPKHFKIILCGRVVEPHHIVNDLIYCECIKYRPQVGINAEVDVITTIGYLRGAPKLDVHGFNIYHKNRLILPFRRVHSVGYVRVTKALPPAYFASTVARNDDSLAVQASTKTYHGNSRARESVLFDLCSNGESSKRRNPRPVIDQRAQKRQEINRYDDQPADTNVVQMKDERIRHLIDQKKVLKDECSKLEAAEQQLLSKAESLRNELLNWQQTCTNLTEELRFYDGIYLLQRNPYSSFSLHQGSEF
uniref:Morc S5 domain-containing protein n=1 Tax=Leersia perrieri TaxID=77586 RepID=A0A0D9WTN6_9ORYZ